MNATPCKQLTSNFICLYIEHTANSALATSSAQPRHPRVRVAPLVLACGRHGMDAAGDRRLPLLVLVLVNRLLNTQCSLMVKLTEDSGPTPLKEIRANTRSSATVIRLVVLLLLLLLPPPLTSPPPPFSSYSSSSSHFFCYLSLKCYHPYEPMTIFRFPPKASSEPNPVLAVEAASALEDPQLHGFRVQLNSKLLQKLAEDLVGPSKLRGKAYGL